MAVGDDTSGVGVAAGSATAAAAPGPSAPRASVDAASLADAVLQAHAVLPFGGGADLDATVAFFGELGLRVDRIFPADDPRVVELSGHGARLRLERDDIAGAGAAAVAAVPPPPAPFPLSSPAAEGAPRAAGRLRLLLRHLPPGAVTAADGAGGGELVAPNGTVVELAVEEEKGPSALPPLKRELIVCKGGSWTTGRAGMRYRDLLPGRLGGRFIASLIHIPVGGLVPDYVHFHAVRFQLIYVVKGWVRVVYEDQGEPFVMESGDCVLQPPLIRHRVLESSSDLYVVEVGSPAEHETRTDRVLELPTGALRPERDFGGQRFCRHRATEAVWSPWRQAGFEYRDTGIGAATSGLGGVRVVRQVGSAAGAQPPPRCAVHDAELLFCCVLAGSLTLRCRPSAGVTSWSSHSRGHWATDGHAEEHLGALEAFSVPAGMPHELVAADGTEWLEVTLPGEPCFVDA